MRPAGPARSPTGPRPPGPPSSVSCSFPTALDAANPSRRPARALDRPPLRGRDVRELPVLPRSQFRFFLHENLTSRQHTRPRDDSTKASTRPSRLASCSAPADRRNPISLGRTVRVRQGRTRNSLLLNLLSSFVGPSSISKLVLGISSSARAAFRAFPARPGCLPGGACDPNCAHAGVIRGA